MRSEAQAGPITPAAPLQIERLESLAALPESAWADLNPEASPFLDYSYLSQLEERGLVGAGTGWQPTHLLARQDRAILAAMPLYEKSDSFGEFVFDWAWADAYQRTGRRYFPKLVCAVPYTPVPGQRVLAARAANAATALPALLAAARELAVERGSSSLHVLFPSDDQARALSDHGLEMRADCRFLWKNAGFSDFDDFLEIFSSRQRKNIRRERQKVRDAGIHCDWIAGSALAGVDWEHVHRLCAGTFYQHGHTPYLDAEFFDSLARNMPDRLLLNLSQRGGELLAAAIYFRDEDALYGRYWGASEQVSCLHFEACYYQGIDYAIRHKLERFDPGTQGAHKLRRGFVPVPSWSLHWFADAQLGAAIARWLVGERRLVREYIEHCRATMPFRAPPGPNAEFWP